MAVYPKPELGPVQSVTGGYGFNIISQSRQPLLMFAYASKAEAEAGREAVERALSSAVEVVTMPA